MKCKYRVRITGGYAYFRGISEAFKFAEINGINNVEWNCGIVDSITGKDKDFWAVI